MKKFSPSFKTLRVIVALAAIFTGTVASAQWYNTSTETAYGATAQTITTTDQTWSVGSSTYTLFSVTEGTKYRFTTSGSPSGFDTRITGHKDGESSIVRFYGNTGVIGSNTAVEWVADFTGTLRVSSSRGAGLGWQGGGSGNSHVLKIKSVSDVTVTQPVITASAVPASNRIDLNTKESNTANLRAYYPFEERTGTTVSDWGPNNYDGTNTSGTAWGEGISQTSLPTTGSALSLSGGYAEIANASTKFNFGTGAFTYEFWMNGSSFAAGNNTYFECGQWSGNSIILRQDNASGIYLYVSATSVASWSFTPQTGKWYHIALTRSGTTYTIYVNGTVLGTSTNGGGNDVTPAAGTPLRIGSSVHTTGQTFQGRIDEFRVYNVALTDNQIIADALQGFRVFNINKNTAATQLKLIKTAEYDVNDHYDLDNFENVSDEWVLRNGVDPSISTGQQFTGAASLYMPTGWGQNFEVGASPTNIESGATTSYNTDNFPFLSFAYKIPAGRVVNMLINTTAGSWRSITMTQTDFPTGYPILGTYPQSTSMKPVYADNAWHYKTINLREMIGTNQTVNSIIWHEGQGSPAISGDFYIDDFVASKYALYNTNDYPDNNSVLNPVIDVAAPTIPGAPTVTVTSSTQLDMSWSGISDNGTTYYYNAQPHDGLGTVGTAGTTNVVYTKGLDANPYQVNETTAAAGATDGAYQSGLTYSDNGLSANTQYCYQVRARDQAVNSSNVSAPNESSYSTPTCKYTRATCVTTFTATTSTTTCGAIDLAWSGGAKTTVRVRNTTSGTDIYTGSGSSTTQTGLTAGSTQNYEIYVRNGDVLEETSACLTASAAAPAQPTLTTAATPAVVTRVCVSGSNQNTVLPYTASSGNPISYSITWTGIANQGTTSYTFIAGGGSVSGIVVPGGTAAGTYSGTMTYTTGAGCTNTKTLTLTVDAYPDLSPAANASPLCENSGAVTLTSSVASIWSVSGNGSFGTATSTTTNNFTPALYSGSAQNVTATITLTNGACVNATRTIRVDNKPVADAGVDQAKCAISNFTMAGNDPATGGPDPVIGSTGMWTCTGGCGGVTPAPTNTGLTSGVSNGTTSTLQWTVTNATCSHSDQVNLTNDQQNFINGNTTLCDAPGAATYTYTSTPSSSNWSIDASTPGTGSITSGGIFDPIDIVAPAATMPVIIKAQNGACTGSLSITVYNKPTVSTPSGAAICEGMTLNLASDITPANVSWSVAQGPNCTSCLTGTTFVAPNPGSTSALYGIDAATGPGCSSTVYFNVDQGVAIAGFPTNPMPVCDNSTLSGLTSTPAAFWAVTSGGGSLANVGFSTLTNTYTPPSLSAPTQNSSGNIRVTSQNGACIYNFPIRIDNQNTLNTPTTPICESASAVTSAVVGDVNGVTWGVNMGTGLTGSSAVASSNNKNADVTYGSVATPTQNATLTVTATNGACTVASVNIQVDNNNSILATQTPICETGTSFIDGDVNGVVWTASSGSFTSPAQDITLSGVTVVSGQLDVTVTATNGACPPKTTHVFVDDSPNTTSFSTSATSPICASGTSVVTITCAALGSGTFTVTYDLSGGNTATGLTATVVLTSGTGSFTTAALTATGTTTITLTAIQNAAGCSASLTTGNTANVVVNAAPTVTITGYDNVCEGTSITLTANPAGGAGSPTNYKWERNFNGGAFSQVQNGASATYATLTNLTPGSYDYKVTLTQSGANCTAISSNVPANVAQQPYSLDPAMQADICKGGSATFTATLTGGGTPTLLYEWLYSDLSPLVDGTPTDHHYSNANTAALTISTDNTAVAGNTGYVLKVSAAGTGCNASFSVDNTLNVFADPTVSAPSPAVQSGICSGGTPANISVIASNGTGGYSYQWYINTTNANTGGTLISGATSATYSPVAIAGTRYYYAIVGSSGNGCGTDTSATAEVTVAATVLTASAIVDECVSVGGTDKYYVLVSGAGGTPPYAYPGAFYTASSGQGVYEVSPNTTATYPVTDANSCSANSASITTPTGHPTSITLTPSTPGGVVTSDCWVSNYNKWVTFRDGITNEAIMAIDDNTNDLGLVTVNVYKDASAPVILSDQYVNNGGCGGPSTAMRRHFKVTTTQAPTGTVDVALFFSDQEYIDLKNDAFNSNIPYPQQGYECSNDDDVYNFNGLYVTKYSGPNGDGDYMNNIGTAGYYKVFGDNTTPYLPLTKGEHTTNGTGFQSIYGGTETHHYVQLTVTEFSEFWLHGSSHAEALPVQMIFLQADAINNTFIRLTWATAIEINNKGFEVERSVDGQSWTKVGFVDGHNNATIQNNYSYEDKDVTAGVVYFYRLKQVDYDGAFEYTDIVSARLKGDASFGVKDFIPNPTMDKTTLIITAVKDQEISVVFYNLVGQKVLESNTMVNKGYNQLQFSLEKLAAGTYTAVVSAANEVYTKKIVLTK